MDLNTTLERVPDAEKLGGRHRVAEPGAVERFFSAVPEALANTEGIAREADATRNHQPAVHLSGLRGAVGGGDFPLLPGLCEEGVQPALRGHASRYPRAPRLRAGASSGRRGLPPTSWWCATSSSNARAPAAGEARPPASSPTSWASPTWIPCATPFSSSASSTGAGRTRRTSTWIFPGTSGRRR